MRLSPHFISFTLAIFGGLLFAGSGQAASDSLQRERLRFTDNWRFQKGDPEEVGDGLQYERIKPWLIVGANAFTSSPQASPPEGERPGEKLACIQAAFDDSSWRPVTLPHDWGVEGDFVQALPGDTGKLPWSGVGWYRKSFDSPPSDRGRQISLEIDGAMAYAAVWCNGKFVGGWPYGYASWHLDLTPFIHPGANNTLAIRLDNPPESSRWYPGGGIYRNVWLTKTAPVHVDHWGTQITTPQVSSQSATVKIEARIVNQSSASAQIRAVTRIFKCTPAGGWEGSPVATTRPVALTLAPGEAAAATAELTLTRPALWDIQNPQLYTAVTSLEQDGKTVDCYPTHFGVRKAEFTVNDGFHLNGKRVAIQGVCNHHDLGALGAAFNIRAAERQLQILKEMGANAIRTSHNPPAPELLDLCDRMGFLVMDEFVDCWKLPKRRNGYNLLFSDWSEGDVRSYVRRDRNHPSVILWSIGNEIKEQVTPEGPAMGMKLTGFVRLEDATRPTAIGVSAVPGGYNGFQTGVNVFGYNYRPGEYQKFRAANPDQPLFGSETASTISSRGEYFFPFSPLKTEGRYDFQISSYDIYTPPWATLPDVEFKGQDDAPFVAGEFVWTGFDYLGEPSPYNSDKTILLNYHSPEEKARAEKELKLMGKIKVPSRSSYFGIVDLAGFKKDRFYLYQARWRPELPMAHILPHWNWEGRLGEVTPVHVYTSGDEAELFLNGNSLGRKKKGQFEYRLRWEEVKYEPGELKVVAYKNGKEWATSVVKTTEPAAKVLLTADRASIAGDGRDLSFVTATVADQSGLMVPRANPKLKFTLTGPGEIVATDNGNAIDHTGFHSAERAAFNGLALAIVRAKAGATEPITLRVTSEGLAAGEVVLRPGQ